MSLLSVKYIVIYTFVEVAPDHSARCHFADELELQGVVDVANGQG